jgi:hypothetical protein
LAAERRLLPAVGERPRSGTWARLLAAPLTVVALLVVALVVRLLLTEKIVTPWILADELIYSDLAKSFAQSGSLLLRSEHFAFYTALYPVLIAPAWLTHSMEGTYGVAKAINALLMTLTAVPLYAWARRLVSPRYALLAVVLFLVMPSLLYAGTLMTENAFLPVFVLAAFAIALALERPTLTHQALALGAVVPLALIRLQGFILVLVLITSILVMAVLDGRPLRSHILRFRPTFVAIAVVSGGYVVVNVVRGAALPDLLGAYRVAAETDYSAADAGRWVIQHFAELGLSVALVPAFALIVLVVCAVRGRLLRTASERAFLAVTTASVLWLPVQSGIFASRFSERIQERTMMCVQPLLLLALVLWLARGLPRPRLPTALAVLVPSALLLTLPLAKLLGQPAVSDTFGLIPLLSIRERWGMTAVTAFVWSAALALAVLFAVVRRPHARVLVPLAVAASLTVSTIVVAGKVDDQSRDLRAAAQVGEHASWVDRAIGRDANAAIVYTPDVAPPLLWHTEFWNRSVHRILTLEADEPGGLPQTRVSLNRRTGELVSARRAPPYVVVPRGLVVDGERLTTRGPWRLYRAGQQLRLQSSLEGAALDGWMGKTADYTAYRIPGRAPSAIEVIVSRRGWGGPDVASKVRVKAWSLSAPADAASRTGVLRSSADLRFLVPAPSRPFRVRISIDRTFSPESHGSPDKRQLSAIPTFRLLGAA